MESKGKNLWSHKVETHWEPPKGFFERTPQEIAKGLKENSDSLAQAQDRLNFYVNRAGTNLSASRKADLEKAKKALEGLYGEEETHH